MMGHGKAEVRKVAEGPSLGCHCPMGQQGEELGWREANLMAQAIWAMSWQMGRLDEAPLTSNAPRALPTSPPKRSTACAGQHLCIVMGCLQPQHHRAASQQINRLTAPCRGLDTAQPHWDARGQSPNPASSTETFNTSPYTHTQAFRLL